MRGVGVSLSAREARGCRHVGDCGERADSDDVCNEIADSGELVQVRHMCGMQRAVDSDEIGPRAAEARGSRANLCQLFVARTSLQSLRRRPRPTRPTPVQVGGRLRSGGGPAPRRRRAFRALTVIWCRLGPARTRPGTGPAPRLPEPGRRWFGPGNRNPRGRAGSRRRARADVNVVSLRAMCRRRRRRGIPRSAKQDRKRGFGRMREFAGRVPLFAWLCTVKIGACERKNRA